MTKKIMKNGKGSWGFNDEFIRNIIIFEVANSSSHNDNFKNYFLILGEGDTFGINESFYLQGKKLILILLKQRQSFV